MAQQDKRREVYAKVVARTWRDPAFKAKLMADPQGTLKDAGITMPAGATVTVLENTATHSTWCCRPSRRTRCRMTRSTGSQEA